MSYVTATIYIHTSIGLAALALGVPAVAQLVEAELLFRRGVSPEASYTFKHALVRDAAYASLLKSRRRQYHARIARVVS